MTTADSSPLLYEPSTDALRVELRPWPDPVPDHRPELVGGRDAGVDLVIHDGPDGLPCAREFEHASRHPEHIAAALDALRAAQGYKDAA